MTIDQDRTLDSEVNPEIWEPQDEGEADSTKAQMYRALVLLGEHPTRMTKDAFTVKKSDIS